MEPEIGNIFVWHTSHKSQFYELIGFSGKNNEIMHLLFYKDNKMYVNNTKDTVKYAKNLGNNKIIKVLYGKRDS